jgi:intracellular multiplication protein IcmO
MAARSLRGLEERNEQKSQQLLRDTRTLGQKFADFLKNPLYAAFTLIMLAATSSFLTAIADICALLGILLFIVTTLRKTTLPFRLPMRSGRLDYNDTIPGTTKPRKARGIYFFGNQLLTDQELWFANEDMRTHVLIFGSTGSGKTEALISLAYNALVQGSGFIYVDGKGDNSLFAKVFSMVRSMGREDDLLLINYMTGAKDIIGPQKRRLSNTMNPFAIGSSSMLSQLVVSLMESGSSGGDGDMWKGRAINFVEALMKVLVAMRDAGHILLDANSIRNYFALERIEAMVTDKAFIRDDQDPISIEGFPAVVLEPIKNYLHNLPGYNKTKKGQQVSQVLEQHGYITMQLTRVFGSLADTYGHIMRTKLAEVDFKDVVLNRRILVVLLPALEKSPDELSNLGKVIIASLKGMMAAGLGDAVEGEYRDLIQRKPTNAPTPYLCILDEYGYYAVKGFAVVPAQARSLGFSVIFAGQDLPAFQKASKEEALSIGANTNIKICMKLEDPLDTWDFFTKTAGESYVTHVKEFQSDAKNLSSTYQDSRSAQVEKRARIDLLDLKEQREGEAHIFFKSKLVRAKMFYANPAPVKKMHLNQFLKVDTPLDVTLYEMSQVLRRFEAIKTEETIFEDTAIPPDDLDRILYSIETNESQVTAIEKAVTALIAYREGGDILEEDLAEEPLPELSEQELNLFTPLRLSDALSGSILTQDIEAFVMPFLDPLPLREHLMVTERLMGQGERRARNVARDLVKDMQLATHYPPYMNNVATPSELRQMVVELTAAVALKKAEPKPDAPPT